jgi:hypothetical protein
MKNKGNKHSSVDILNLSASFSTISLSHLREETIAQSALYSEKKQMKVENNQQGYEPKRCLEEELLEDELEEPTKETKRQNSETAKQTAEQWQSKRQNNGKASGAQKSRQKRKKP